jgi:hypothetical protein
MGSSKCLISSELLECSTESFSLLRLSSSEGWQHHCGDQEEVTTEGTSFKCWWIFGQTYGYLIIFRADIFLLEKDFSNWNSGCIFICYRSLSCTVRRDYMSHKKCALKHIALQKNLTRNVQFFSACF